MVVAAGVAVRGRRVGAPLHHPEGQRRAGEVVAAAEGAGTGPGAGEDVDAVGQAGRRRRHGRQGENRHRREDGCSRSAHEANTLRVVPVPDVMFPAPMRARIAILAAVAIAAVALVLVLVLGGDESDDGSTEQAAVPGEPSVDIVSPRNGARQTSHAVVVKVGVQNFSAGPAPLRRRTAARRGAHPLRPQPRARLRRPGQTAAGDESPVGKWPPGRRLLRLSPATRGPTACWPKRIGASGSYSAGDAAGDLLPRTSRPASTGWSSPWPATTARPLPTTRSPTSRSCRAPGTVRAQCKGGKVSSAKAAAFD